MRMICATKCGSPIMDKAIEIAAELWPLMVIGACVAAWAVFVRPYTKDEQ